MSLVDKILAALSALPAELYIFIISMLPIVELRGAIPIGAVLDVPFYLNFIIAVVGNLLPVPLILLFIPRILDLMEKVKVFAPIVRWLKGKAERGSKKVIGSGAEYDGAEVIGEDVGKDVGAAECDTADAVKSDITCGVECGCEGENVAKSEVHPENFSTEGGDGQTKKGVESKTPTERKMTRAIFISLMLFVALPAPGTGAWSGGLVASLFNLPKKWSFLSIALGVLICGVIMSLASYGVLGFLSFLI